MYLHRKYKSVFIRACSFVCLSVILFFCQVFTVYAAPGDVMGWGWSSNVGWISFNSANISGATVPFKVNVDTTMTGGNFSGYAMYDADDPSTPQDEGKGWIDFGPTSGFPAEGPNHGARMDWTTGEATGWAKALAGGGAQSGGFDGWIKLSGNTVHATAPKSPESPIFAKLGPLGRMLKKAIAFGQGLFGSNTALASHQSYGVTIDSNTGKLSGYAWGSSVIGWINFDPGAGPGVFVTGPLPSVNNRPQAVITGPPGDVTKYTDSSETATQSFTGTGDDSTLPGNLNYQWFSDAGCTVPETGPGNNTSTYTRTYTGNGTYTMCLKVQDEGGLWSTNNPSRTITLQFAECSDGIDNADPEDTIADYPADPGCSDGLDNDETDPILPQCSNKLDDDGDGKFDFDGDDGSGPNPVLIDPGCVSQSDNNEDDSAPVCFQDGFCDRASGETGLNCPRDCFNIREF